VSPAPSGRPAEATLYVANAGSAIGRLDEKGDSVAKTAAGVDDPNRSVADEFRRLGVEGVLVCRWPGAANSST